MTRDAQRIAPQQTTPTTMPQMPRKYPEYTRGPDTEQAWPLMRTLKTLLPTRMMTTEKR